MTEPLARRTIFSGFRRAAIDLWNEEGLREIGARMSDDARLRSVDALVIQEEMLPERFVLEWYVAVWEGPAGRDRALYNRFLNRMMDHGFGRVRKFLLGMATPSLLLRKSAELWRHDHTHGELTYAPISAGSAHVRLTDHPYVETPLARSSIAEIYRYAVSLARVSATADHRLADERTLLVHISWK